MCAPNDVWSLGVILVNLTCGRNPWKQASTEDSTYRAYARNPRFLKTILPLTDELNDILEAIFTRDPGQRITLSELRRRILGCARFTVQPAARIILPQQPVLPEHALEYVDFEESIIDDEDDEFDYDVPLSPVSSNGMSDAGSACSSDDGSLTSSCSSLEDLEEDLEDFHADPHEAKTPPPLSPVDGPAIYEPEIHALLHFSAPNPQDCFAPFPGSVPAPMAQPRPAPLQQSCAFMAKFQMPQDWESVIRCAQHVPQLHQSSVFHHQIPPVISFHGSGFY